MVHLTIDSAEQLPTAEAVIAAMYGVPGAVTSLEQQQLVRVVVIADRVHAVAAGQQAMQALEAAAKSQQSLSTATMLALAGLSVWPSCLLQLLPTIVEYAPCCKDSTADLAATTAVDVCDTVQKLLVAVFGDLQAVWSNAEIELVLLELLLPAMQLLLSSDQLQVPSEDTVLYTAKRYLQAQSRTGGKAAAKAALAALIRAPHLSPFALKCAALPAESAQKLPGAYAQKLRDLLSLKLIASAEELVQMLETDEGAPASWRLGSRQIRPLADGVRVEWRLPVEQLKQACRNSFAQQKGVRMHSPCSPPLGGVAWRMAVCAQQDGGTMMGLLAGRVRENMLDGSCFNLEYTVTWRGKQRTSHSRCVQARELVGFRNYFKLQRMTGYGWDEAVWAAAGLPTTGEMLLQLHVHSVE